MSAEPAATRASSDERLAVLDGLRGIAIALVVWYHIWQITWLPADVHVGPATLNANVIPETGFVGVDLFFFISGFVLFLPYARALVDGRPRPSVRDFFARRIAKIVPSYYLSIVVAIAFGWAHFASGADAFAQIATHLVFVHDWWNQTYGGINGVLWSLAVEAQFYALFPIVSWCALRRPLVTFGTLAGIAIGYRLVVVHHADAPHQIQQLPGTLDLFAAGMCAAYAYRTLATHAPTLASRRGAWTAVAIAGACASALALRSAYDARTLPDWPTFWYASGRTTLAVSFFVLALGSLFAVPTWQRALANPLLRFLSLVSYNLYLYHQLLARALLAARLPPWTGASEHVDTRWGLSFTFVAATVSVAVAWLATRCVEQPIVRARSRGHDRLRTFTSARV